MANDILRTAFDLLSKPLSAESEQRLDFAIEQYDAEAREATYQYYPGSDSDSSESEDSVSVRDKAVTPPMVGLGPPPMPENASSELQQMLTAWYYAGYYAGLYAGKNIRNS